VPLGTTFTSSFTVSGPGVGAGSSPLTVLQTSPANGTLFSAPLGYGAVSFSEALSTNLAQAIPSRFAAMLIAHTGGVTTGGSGYADVPLNAKLAFNPNTNQLILVPTGLLMNGTIYLFSLSSIKATNGDSLKGGTQFASFEWSTNAHALRPSTSAADTAVPIPVATAAVPGGPLAATTARRAESAQAVGGYTGLRGRNRFVSARSSWSGASSPRW
jgi:hypothetical protein